MSPSDPTTNQEDTPPAPGPGRAPAAGPPNPGFALAVVLIAAAVGAGAYWLLPSRSALVPGAAEREPITIKEGERIVVPQRSPLRSRLVVADVQSKEISRTLVLPAIVEADPGRTVKVIPPLTGRMVSLKVQLGERVAQGQELAVIDSGDLAQAFSDNEKAHAMLTLTKQALDRLQSLEKSGAIAIKEREQAQSDHAQAVSELARSETRLRSFGMSPDQPQQTRLLSLKAPAAGSVIDLEVAQGDFLNDTTAAIMTIANLDTVWVTANVPEKDTLFVSAGQPVDVTFPAYPGETFAGKVLFVSDVLEPDTRRTKVRIAFDNPNKALKPNMFANAKFAAPAQNVPVVPASALVLKDNENQVFVETAPWTFEARDVDIDFQQGDQIVLAGGVKAGERVVVKGGVLLGD